MINRTLWASAAGGTFKEVHSSQYLIVVTDYLDAMLRGLSIVDYRGAIQVEIRNETNVTDFAATISFTDDFPDGQWLVTQDDVTRKQS